MTDMLSNLSPNVNKVCIHTGNILSLNEVKKKAGQSPTEELIESLRITLSSWTPPKTYDEGTIQVYRNGDDLQKKMVEEDRKELKMSVKAFIHTLNTEALTDAINNVLDELKTECIDSLVLAYSPGGASEPGVLLNGLQQLWLVLEGFVDKHKLGSIGVSDTETDVFISLYNWAKVKPSIVQINLAACCVVPPALQAFTKENDVQLLTHSDPGEILPPSSLQTVLGCDAAFKLSWALRFQIHVKCRGVLSSKGYTLCISRGLRSPDI